MGEVETKELTANQLYKQYKDDGGTLVFSKWLDREKKKGIFPLNMDLNNEVNKAINGVNEKSISAKSMSVGKSNTALFIVLGLVVGSFVAYKIYKNSKK